MNSKKGVTIYDIAQQLKITPSMVSRALSGNGYVNDATRQLVRETAEALNYKRNTVASNLRMGQTKTIGVIVPRINQNFFANVIAGIENIAYEKGYSLIICQSDEQNEKEVKSVNTLINQRVECIVISVSADSYNYKHLQNVIDQGIQLIQFDRVAEDLDTLKVINDNEQASFDAIRHLIEQGYKKIALLEGPQNLAIFRQRKNGYLRALKQHGLPVKDDYIIENAWTKELGAAATKKLLGFNDAPDAIFASTSDFSALGVLEVANQLNIKVPSQLGICGYSNEAFTEITSPSITTVDQYSVDMGKTVANLFFDRIEEQADAIAAKTVSIKPELIIRGSTSRMV
ncbi:LacI family DNA-binding transcriptional regulator [Mucilaginibacter sp. L3T2-6]|uniref:LacI family DNA-binding transcriptional regulator n=1 Tax=Mucilaginibacter sp. L3T2-6 TaxID=3062491 RepID=UPI002676BC26|nr:LacI family DNA-binding transcriptional regulator [Mucilaginibacter sp. L3T2-6]MDO3644145.1 LacI family DNA-binding transcriptional regulator [Mucilaginibacter sp. L3T2-6]MDV6216574.1 LacI family DNA-binding transcriptional regulator [Mucilaginibacter sp. L3T2-6]